MFREYTKGNESYLEIDTPEWHAEIILSVGSNMLELTDRKTGLNLLRTPPSLEELKFQPEVWGFPVLIPPNCIYKGLFSWRGRHYQLPVNNRFGNHIHGVVLRAPWKLASTGEEDGAPYVETTYTYDENNGMFKGFPHTFKVNLRYVFRKDRVLQRLTAVNAGSETMPFAAGFHASFNFPLGAKTPEAYRTSKVFVSVADFHWEMDRKIRFAVTGKKAAWNGYDDFIHGKIVNREPVSRQCPVAEREIDGIRFHGAILDFPVSGVKIFYRWDPKYTQTALWNFDGMRDFFCAEPMSWMADSPNLPLTDEDTGVNALSPWETWSAENQVWVESK